VDVQNALDKYPNLKIVSRDRGLQYRNLSNKYIHIADRFHLIKNICDRFLKEVKKLLPKRILICNDTENIDETQVIIKESQMSDAQKNKIELIKLTKEVYQKVGSLRATARTLKLNRKTVKIYIDSENIVEDSKYKGSKRKSFLDRYNARIFELYDSGNNILEVHKILNSEIDINVKYSTLRYHIRKYRDPKKKSVKREKFNREYIKRRDIINYILNWSKPENEEKENNILEIINQSDELVEFFKFYRLFRHYLVNLKFNAFKELINETFKFKMINNFIENLHEDYDAVINSAKFIFNNSITEGNVSKIKKIKKDMYGRAGFKLLRRKVLFQSFF
jgi:hypothetical protein